MNNDTYTTEEIRAVQKASLSLGGMNRLAGLAQALCISGAMAEAAREVAETSPTLTRTRRVVKAKALKVEKQAAPKPAGEKRARATKAEVDALKTNVLARARELNAEFSSGEIANHLDVDRNDVSRALKKLEAEGLIRHEGTKAATRYCVK